MFGFVKAKKGERALFDVLIQQRIEVLYRIAYSYFRDKDKASDAVQDTILIAYKSFDKLKDKDKFNSWITTILVNRCRDILRRNKKINLQEYDEKVLDINTIKANVKSEYSKLEDKLFVIQLLDSIDKKYREVISLKYLGDYTIEEISVVLDIPQGTVKSRLNTGIKKLRTLMEVKDNVM
jgi:RNA polymerase sigma-70 factor (ECF subfamily)